MKIRNALCARCGRSSRRPVQQPLQPELMTLETREHDTGGGDGDGDGDGGGGVGGGGEGSPVGPIDDSH